MTEAEWLTKTDPYTLIKAERVQTAPRKMQLFGQPIEIQETTRFPLILLCPRKLRLFGVACCRRASERLGPTFRDLLVEVERQVDESGGLITHTPLHTQAKEELDRLHAADRDNYRPGIWSAADAVVDVADPDISLDTLLANLSNNLSCSAAELARPEDEESRWPPEALAAADAENAAHCELVRDIFGNPFRPVTFDPSWRTSTVVNLAAQMYESRDFSLMPILADALQDAGGDNSDILNHCRGSGPHVRGCWVVDLVLDRSPPPPLAPALT